MMIIVKAFDSLFGKFKCFDKMTKAAKHKTLKEAYNTHNNDLERKNIKSIMKRKSIYYLKNLLHLMVITLLSYAPTSSAQSIFTIFDGERAEAQTKVHKHTQIPKFDVASVELSKLYDESDDIALTTDSRIKTYVYSPNEVYLLVLHYGFQSHIEFAKGETIDTLTLGDSFAWKLTPLGNKLFIKPMEKNIRTNMTIITNKRTYHFDIAAKELEEDEDKDLVYVIRFQYPKKAR